MAKIKLEELNNEQFDIVQEIAEMFEISEEEALEQALADGSIELSTGGGVSYLPEGYKELKYYVLNNKSNLFKANKAYKKENKKDLFEEDTFYYDIKIPKLTDDEGNKTDDFDVANMSATPIEGNPEVIITNVLYKAERKIFKGATPQENNFESTLGSNMFEEGQREMIVRSTKDDDIKGKSVYELVQGLKKKYGKEKSKIPASETYSFRIVVFGLIKINDSWEKFYFVALNRFGDDNMITKWDSERKGSKANYLSRLITDGEDANANPIFKLEVEKKFSLEDLAEDGLKLKIRDAVKEVSSWQVASVENASKKKTAEKESNTENDTEEEDSVDWDD
jgi:hypothetical protein